LAGKGFCPETTVAHPTHPPEPGLGYLCLLLVKLEKKVSLSGTAVDRADRPVGWSRRVAGTIFLFTCVVYQNQSLQMRQRVTCLVAEIRPFSVFFRRKNPASQRAPPSSCSVVLDTKNVLKKICAPERTVDQNKADNPGSERAGVGHFWVGAELVSSSVTYHDGSRVGPTRPGPD